MASPATTDLTLTMKAELCAYAHTSRHDCWAVANLKAPLFRGPVDVVAVIDVSSSMAKVKLKLMKKALRFVVGQLQECDRFALVTYSDSFKLAKMTTVNKAKATTSILSIRYRSGSNLCRGLLKGMKKFARYRHSEKIKSVLLLTDALATKGVNRIDEILAEMMQIQNPQSKKVPQNKFDGTVYTFGFGADHDAGILTAIAMQGGGTYYSISTSEKIPEYFADCLGGLRRVVGKNLSLKMEIQGDNQLNEVHSSCTVNWTTPNKSCDVSLGDIQSEEGRDIVMNLILPALAVSTTENILKATLSYFNVITSSMQTISCDLVVSRTDAAPGASNPDLDQLRNCVAALKKAKALADQENIEDAMALLDEAIVNFNQSASNSYISKTRLVELEKMNEWLGNKRSPTSVHDTEWIYAYPHDDDALFEKKSFGKWLVFRDNTEMDETWQRIKEHICNGDLGAIAAKSSTMVKSKTGLYDHRGVICVYTTEKDIDEVGLKLIRLVVDERLRYKTNAATLHNVFKKYAQKPSYKILLLNNGDPKFIFEKQYGQWYIRCDRHDNFDSMLKSIQQASEDGVLGDVPFVHFFRPSTENVHVIVVCTTKENVQEVGFNIIQIVRHDITFKTTNMCAGKHMKAYYRWNKGKPAFTCVEVDE